VNTDSSNQKWGELAEEESKPAALENGRTEGIYTEGAESTEDTEKKGKTGKRRGEHRGHREEGKDGEETRSAWAA